MALLPSPTTFPTLRLYTSPSASAIIQTCAVCITAYLKGLFLTTSPLTTAPPEALLYYHLVSQPPLQTGLLLEVTGEDGKIFYLAQIIAILGYMEELGVSERRLLPPAVESAQRASNMELMSILSSHSSLSLHMDNSSVEPDVVASDVDPTQRLEGKEIESRLLACESLVFPGDDITLAHTMLIPLTKHAICHHGMNIAADPRFLRLWPIFRSCIGMWEFREGVQAGEKNQREDDEEESFTLDKDAETSSEEDSAKSDEERKYEGTLLEFSE